MLAVMQNIHFIIKPKFFEFSLKKFNFCTNFFICENFWMKKEIVSIWKNGIGIRLRNRSLKILFNLSIWSIFMLVFNDVSGFSNEPGGYYRLSETIIILAGLFYLNGYVFIPRLLSRRKFGQYAFSIFCTLIIIFILNYFFENFIRYAVREFHPGPENKLEYGDFIPDIDFKPFSLNFEILLLCITSLAISTSIRVTREWFKKENQLKEIENQKRMAELSYLKAQINPHFFFNTLNGIYALARQKSDKTADIIMNLSVIMRYIIYDARSSKVTLTEELKHIDNYIDLQKIRLPDHVKIRFEVHGNPQHIMIEPLLFSAFVENAFKHGIDYSEQNTISIIIDILDEELKFTVSNPIAPLSRKELSYHKADSGVGLENIRKRLELLYPDKHVLKISKTDQNYMVELILKMKS